MKKKTASKTAIKEVRKSKSLPVPKEKRTKKVAPKAEVKPRSAQSGSSRALSGSSARARSSSSSTAKAGLAKQKQKDGKTRLVSRETAEEGMRLLCQKYPDADCELTFKTDFQLLTAVILSAQTTDVQVNKVTPVLFKKFPDAKSLSSANLDEIKEIVKPTGYYNNKAKAIQACASALVQKFGGRVPNNLEELTTLPGVGRKTANVVLGVIHKIPGWTVDTHVQRLTQRLGFTTNTDPAKIEKDLQNLFPEQNWTKYSITLIWHGRRQCYARNPDCPSCPVKHLCPSSLAP